MNIQIQHADVHLIDLRTRLPAKYGIVTMTGAPHAFIRTQVEVDGRVHSGIAADNLPPKWFKKDLRQALDEETDEMLRVIEHAVSASVGMKGSSAFDVWKKLDAVQQDWGRAHNLPSLLSNFGTALVERALVEAICKSLGSPFARAVGSSAMGIRLGEMDKRLVGFQPADLLPRQPRQRVIARHTVGMADPLTDDDISADNRLNDGLPQSLAEYIQRYGLKHFKIKISGDVGQDRDRLQRTADVVDKHVTTSAAITFDGNEHFLSLPEFREYWAQLTETAALQPLLARLLFVEQPFHRDVALDRDVLSELNRWSDCPKLIIDESDAEQDSLARALELGYHGKGFKNCKGVFRGVAGACLLEKLRRDSPDSSFLLSGEDLANVGPVGLMQDLAVAASLGIESIERNGHHFFAGLSAFPQSVQQQVLQHHGDLYDRSHIGWPTVRIERGELNLQSVNAAPLGVGFELDVEQFQEASRWRQTT